MTRSSIDTGKSQSGRWLAISFEIFMLTVGALIAAVGVVVYMVPSQIILGGLGGIAIILNATLGTPVGLITLLLNIPVMIIGYRMLGGWQVIARTVFFIVVYSLAIDLMTPFLPTDGISENQLLNAIFAGVFGGISGGITFRVGATGGGTSIITRIIQMRMGVPMSTSSLYIDGAIVIAGGVFFGWESVMFAVIGIVIYGITADYVLEGPSVIRTATIVTDQPEAVSQAVMTQLRRGVTAWDARGMYTGQQHQILFVTTNRSQVTALRQLVLHTDPKAFIVIGHGHVAYGEGFHQTRE